jgi:hypothetical protein
MAVWLGGGGAARATGGWRAEPEGRRPGHRGGRWPTKLARGGGRWPAGSRVGGRRPGHLCEAEERPGRTLAGWPVRATPYISLQHNNQPHILFCCSLPPWALPYCSPASSPPAPPSPAPCCSPPSCPCSVGGYSVSQCAPGMDSNNSLTCSRG